MGLILVVAARLVTRRGADRGLAAVLVIWALAQMAYANLRIVAVPLAFGFAALRIGPAPPEDDEGVEGAPPAPAGAWRRAHDLAGDARSPRVIITRDLRGGCARRTRRSWRPSSASRPTVTAWSSRSRTTAASSAS